ncbi:TonB-dependent receptor [Flaviaesturariibacter aridisoli]|uniref:TonB-dependent receptor n=1 Tax=Flaviaesturariibacter aridisoli TaxID=2545761 RepID=A0A4R4E4J6_9BACT|nr:TonB-dependent receptor [Flaviaesturariibacter aridisoli]TCZ73867.1 TonB-dependent receptor [Flaviaesturariibacter aridisoli]
MRKSLRLTSTSLVAVLFSLSVSAQNVTVTGKVKNNNSKENVPAVSVTVKGASQGAYTDDNGNFRLTVNKLPVTLIVSSVGFESREVTVSSASQALDIDLMPASVLGQEVVVSATRAPERILETPVTIERLGSTTLRNVPAPSYFEAINNLKGVDMHTASLTFRTVTTRGFVASGNTRFNQLIDGMDNQAPGLNFSVGNIIGPSDLDIDNMEMLSGASSALYGSGGMNGTLPINTKNPFKFQGLSFQVKQGIMHLQDRNQKPSPYYDWSARYGKAWNEKFGFKVSAQFIKANDWQAYDYDNVQRTSVVSKVVGGNRTTDPNYDGVNVYGDETSANLRLVSQQVEGGIRAGVLGATGGTVDPNNIAAQYLSLFPTPNATNLSAFLSNPAIPAALRPTLAQFIPLYLENRNGAVANQNVSRTGYNEKDLVDYNTINFKGTAGLFYKITPRIEASLNTYWGTGTTVYTGADRYSLKNLQMAQHKLEIRHPNWFVRGYTTQENSGDSYNATVLGRIMNERFKASTGASGWYTQYAVAYALSRFNGASDYQAHGLARSNADQGMPMPGTPAFEALKNAVASAPIGKDPQVNGAKFLDRSDLWAAEGQLNLSNLAGFSNLVDVIAGVQWKQYVLNSQGTLFADTTGVLKPSEIGGYVQLKKALFNNILTLTAAGRYDKHTNFEGRFTPRVTAVIKVFKDNNIRLSYQTAYRFPTNQDQYINLNVGSGLLVGGLPSFQSYYGLDKSSSPGYTSESVIAARTSSDPSKLVPYQYKELKPESVTSYEIGYKGVAAKRFFYDAYAYYSQYKDFLGRVAVVQSLTGSPAGALDPSSASSRNISYVQNSDQQVKAFGWGVSAEFNIVRSYYIYGNVFSDELKDVPEGYITFFNAPKYRTNLGVRADNVWKGVGFNLVWKWQDVNNYEGTFVSGTLPAYHTIDAQLSYRVPNTKSVFRIGATNLANQYYRSGYGSPYVGGLYYASFGYNIF